MGSYKISFKRSAEKELRGLPKKEIQRLLSQIAALADNPYPPGAESLKGENRYYRIRQGDYRVVYEVLADQKVILIYKISHRRDVYRRQP